MKRRYYIVSAKRSNNGFSPEIYERVGRNRVLVAVCPCGHEKLIRDAMNERSDRIAARAIAVMGRLEPKIKRAAVKYTAQRDRHAT